MDQTQRHITKIAREVGRFTLKSLKQDDIGTAELDFIHLVRHCPGITQAGVRDALKIDKGAAARRAANLEEKGYLRRQQNPADHRSRLLYATEKAQALKSSKAALEAAFYEWLLEGLPEDERKHFSETLELLYQKAKMQSRAGFPDVMAFAAKKVRE
ncbi:MAG: MarR family transcriptional regulator [Eubacteriales bacterium]|nr:MarR family transcriptional regulator [Eubacteriales bacterium]